MNQIPARWAAWGTLVMILLIATPSLPAQEKEATKIPSWSQARWGELGILDSADQNEINITALAAAADGKLVATGHAGGLVRLWNPATGIELFVLRGHRGEVCALAFTDAGRTLVSVTAHEILRWDTGSGKQQEKVNLEAGPIEQAVITPDGQTLIGATSAGRVLLINLAIGTETARLERPVRPVLALALSPDGKVVACAEEGGAVTVWNLKTGRVEIELIPEEKRLPRALAFSPNSRLIAVSLGRDGVIVWDHAKKNQRTPIRLSPLTAQALAFAPDGRGLAIGTANGSIVLADVATGKIGSALRGHAGQVQHLVFLPSNRVVSSSTDTLVRLWRAYLPGQPDIKLPEPEWSEQEAAALVRDLGSTDLNRAERATQTMLFMPDQSVKLLRKLIQPVAPADAKRFAQLLNDLQARRYLIREKAVDEIQKMGESARDLIQRALESAPDLETRNRLQLLAQRLERPDSSADLRLALRGVDILGRIGSQEAQRFLEELARGVPGAHLTRAAQRALGQQK